jgi:translation initiation factor IF-1
MTKKKETVLGCVLELLPNARCKVEIDGKEMQCYLAGKMKINKIQVVVGDTVEVVTDDYGNIGRIVRRK